MPPIKRPIADCNIVLLFILPHSRVVALERLLDKFAMDDWRSIGVIHLIPVRDQDKQNPRRILAAVQQTADRVGLKLRQNNVRIQFFDELDEHARYELEKLVYLPDFIHKVSYKKLAADLLEIRLREWGMHWRQAVLKQVSKWQHDQFTETDIDEWLKQFDRISVDATRWIGEQLLRNFRVWSADEFAEKLCGNGLLDASGLPICVFRYENGKSADAISVILRKKMPQFGDGQVHDYDRFLQNTAKETCLVLEDGLFTGVEFSDLLCSLCGEPGYGKCPSLPARSRLENGQTIIRFALGTDIGAHRVRETISRLKIDMVIEICHEVNVLTPAGLASLQEGWLYERDRDGKEVLRAFEQHIIPQAFLDARWGDNADLAKSFCSKVGLELWQSYQAQKGKVWSEQRLGDCALGAGNMGLLFAFAHSLPKSTLPFFWCHGEVLDQHGKRRKWKPLFYSAHLR